MHDEGIGHEAELAALERVDLSDIGAMFPVRIIGFWGPSEDDGLLRRGRVVVLWAGEGGQLAQIKSRKVIF